MYAVREGHTEVLELLLDCPDNGDPEKLLTTCNKVSLMHLVTVLKSALCLGTTERVFLCFSTMFLVSSEGSGLSDDSSSIWPTGVPPANGSVH